ncbi:L-serine dehydratase 2 [Candidatus Izimaplasma bacterium HR1]|jgi:L-serine dehydratase|uniref:L-serine ammonia-lyase, iron-sulfur-dependent, subunit alpha n=1 Tax=Candidatus Izimoplasma sp. HR1 TaxID=1541959 RepID=UPI0004F8CA94|nr:L-serine dehydratase 2 [Candidatus Izimaplasma bacterium HR1]
MESIRELYKIGRGPSSSHTIGPERICNRVKSEYDADRYKVVLYGSLSLTGKGHLTDKVIEDILENVEVVFSSNCDIEHPNTMDVLVYKGDELIANDRYYSIGGGSILKQGDKYEESKHIYPHKNFDEIQKYCKENNLRLYEYVYKYEDKDFKEFLETIWFQMKDSINLGLHTEGVLPGELEVVRKARSLLYNQNLTTSNQLRLVSAYAYAVSEVNANSGTVVTAPTCGASGVLPSVLYYLRDIHKFSDIRILDALATAGLIGNIIKHNASISGAEAGCQAEVGTACSMAAAAHSELFNNNIDTIEYAAEIALEHHLGLTCDPVKGHVQIPCIERNAVAAHRAINASELSFLLMGSRKISFDTVVHTMMETGKDLNENYRETSIGGLAKYYKK